MRIATLLHKTRLWYILTYIRGMISCLMDKEYVTLFLPKTDSFNDMRTPSGLYAYYWFSDMIENCNAFSINYLNKGVYWYKPTMAVLNLAYTYEDYFNNVIKSKERALIRRAKKMDFIAGK